MVDRGKLNIFYFIITYEVCEKIVIKNIVIKRMEKKILFKR